MQPRTRALPFRQRQLETSDVQVRVEQEILVGDRGIGEKWAVVRTCLVLVVGWIKVV